VRACAAMRQVHELQTARPSRPSCCAEQQVQGVYLHAYLTTKIMHKFKLCAKCQTDKPPEGGVDMGSKWHCQLCWNRRITTKNLLQHRATPKTTRTP